MCKTAAQQVTFASLMKANFDVDPFQCILCGKNMILELVIYGKSSAHELLNVHRELALLKKIWFIDQGTDPSKSCSIDRY